MGDGYFDKGKSKRTVICTDCFSIDEINRLRDILVNKYNISSYTKVSGNENATGKSYPIVIPRRNVVAFQ